MTLRITGEGDLKKILPFGLKIPGAMVYRTPPEVRFEKREVGYRTLFTQHFTVLALEDFTVPSLCLKLCNPSTGVVEILRIRPIEIEVENPEVFGKCLRWILSLLAAFLLGVVTAVWWVRFRRRRRRFGSSFARSILRASFDDRELYRLLLPYSDDPRIRHFLEKLKANLYANGVLSVDRRQVAEKIEEIHQKEEEKIGI